VVAVLEVTEEALVLFGSSAPIGYEYSLTIFSNENQSYVIYFKQFSLTLNPAHNSFWEQKYLKAKQ